MPETRWLSDSESTMWRDYFSMGRHLERAIEVQLAEHGLSHPDYTVLVVLSENPDGLRVRDLGERIRWESSRLAHHLRRMENRGLISRCSTPDDGRGTLARITSQGRAAIEAAAPGHVETVRRCFVDLLGTEEQRMISSIARRVAQACREEDGDPPLPGTAIRR